MITACDCSMHLHELDSPEVRCRGVYLFFFAGCCAAGFNEPK